MIALLVAVTQWLVVGAGAARRLDPAMPPLRLLGTAYLLGGGCCAFVLLALSVLGIGWTSLSFTAAFCVVAIALWAVPRRPVAMAAPTVARSGGTIALAIDACTLLLVVAYGAYTMKAGGHEWDFWAIWGLKGRVFAAYGGIDWGYLADPAHAFAHPDYPPLVPLHCVQIALLNGGWTDSVLGFLSTLYTAALLLIVRDFLAEEFRRPALAAAATLALASAAFTKAGTGDAPMIAYGTAGLLMIRGKAFGAGAVLLGLAAFTKNEGLALIVAAAVALLLSSRPSAVLRLWPAAAVAAPWLLLRAVHTLPTDLAAGNLQQRALNAFGRIPELARALAEHPPHAPLFLLTIAVALIAYAPRLHEERFLLTAVSVQVLFYLAAYLMTPYQLGPHVATSWPRIVQHMAIPAAFVAVKLVTEGALRQDRGRAGALPR